MLLHILKYTEGGKKGNVSFNFRNPSSRWLNVRIKVVSVILNGRVQDPTRMLPFVVKEKCTIEPKGAESVRVRTCSV